MRMNSSEKSLDTDIENLTNFFDSFNLLTGIFRGNFYYDEPKQYYFTTKIHNKSPYLQDKKHHKKQTIYAGGNSFSSKKLALLKCLGEAVERLCQETFSLKNISFDTYEHLQKTQQNLSINGDTPLSNEVKIGWTSCTRLIDGSPSLIPAQFAHYSFVSFYDEPVITSLISTGGATGTSHEKTLLAGLYEVIERDAFTTTYFIKAPVVHIDIGSIENEEVQAINQSLKKYYLEWHLFDISNDIRVPVYLSLLLDRTGIGPAVTSGASSSHDPIESIMKSVSEATMSRPWIRASLSDDRGYHSIMRAETKGIQKRLERGLYWFYTERIQKLSFWLDLPKVKMKRKGVVFRSPSEELSTVVSRLEKLGFPIYYVNLTHDQLRPFHFKVYKVIVPKLHGLYLDNTTMKYDIHRLDQVASYFNVSADKLNKIPHPFL